VFARVVYEFHWGRSYLHTSPWLPHVVLQLFFELQITNKIRKTKNMYGNVEWLGWSWGSETWSRDRSARIRSTYRRPRGRQCNTRIYVNLKCPLCIPPQFQNHCCDTHNVVGNQFHRDYNSSSSNTNGHSDQVHITTQDSSGNNVFRPMPSPYRQCWLGDDLSCGTPLHILPPDIPPQSLTKLIARDNAMSILNALANYLISK
jgi:hypothetical protein